MGQLNLVTVHKEVKKLLFPLPSNRIDLLEMKKIIQYELGCMCNSDTAASKLFSRYLEEIGER